MLFKACHSVFLILFAVVVIFAGRTLAKRRKTSPHAWLVPFAHLSLVSWVFWALQYLILLAPSLISVRSDFSLNTGLWLGVMQNVLWIIAILSLHSKQFSRLSLTLPLLVMISIVVGFVAYQTTILTLGPFTQIDAVSAATIFMVLGISIVQLRVSKLTAAAFFMHGFFQWIWRYLWFTPLPKIQVILFAFPLWYIALLVAWIALISEMLVTFRVMISSTVKDLAEEREAADRAVRRLNLKGFRAETIGSRPYTPKALCALWAEQCDIFILIIGQSYGHRTKRGKSVVEFEYGIAKKHDPGKIFVYIKEGVTRESELERFREELRDFEKGYITSSFIRADDLAEKIHNDITEWLARTPARQGITEP